MMFSKLAICALVAVVGVMSASAETGRGLLQERVRGERDTVPRGPRDTIPRAPRREVTRVRDSTRRERGTQAPGLDCDGDMCEARWTKCFGTGFSTVSPCCEADHCVMKNEFYAQCRPMDFNIPAGWDGEVLECGAYGEASAGGAYMMM